MFFPPEAGITLDMEPSISRSNSVPWGPGSTGPSTLRKAAAGACGAACHQALPKRALMDVRQSGGRLRRIAQDGSKTWKAVLVQAFAKFAPHLPQGGKRTWRRKSCTRLNKLLVRLTRRKSCETVQQVGQDFQRGVLGQVVQPPSAAMQLAFGSLAQCGWLHTSRSSPQRAGSATIMEG